MVRECIKDIVDDIKSFFAKIDRLDISIKDKINFLQIYVLGFSHGYIVGLKSFGLKPEEECALIVFINDVMTQYNSGKISAKDAWMRISKLIQAI